MWQALCKALWYNVDPIPNSMQVGNTQFRLKHYRDSMLLNRSRGGVSLKTRSSTIPRDIKNGSYIKDYPELLRIGKFWFPCMFAAESLFLRVLNHHFISCFSSLEKHLTWKMSPAQGNMSMLRVNVGTWDITAEPPRGHLWSPTIHIYCLKVTRKHNLGSQKGMGGSTKFYDYRRLPKR